MKYKNLITNNNIFLFCILYISLILGFYFDENLNYGSKADWYYTNLPVIKYFSLNFHETLLSYDQYNHRHSPVYLIVLSFFSKLGLSFDFIRFLHLNFSLILIYFFFKCLSLKFKETDKNILFLLSISIFLSPTFRSLSIWPDTRIIGLIVFVISIYQFLKFDETKNVLYFYKTIIYLILASYISPNFSLFIIFYYFNFLKTVKIKHLFFGLVTSFFFSLPVFYYLFILDVNFLLAGTPGENKNEAVSLDFNISNKLLIISSIIFFHLLPFIINKKFFLELFIFIKKYFLFITIFFLINLYFFDYLVVFTGGGFFFQLSNFLLKNNLIFYFFSLLSFLTLGYFFKFNLKNALLYSLLIFSNIQNTIYHKYYDPLVMILFFLMTVHSAPANYLSKQSNLIILYGFYFLYILLRIFKNSFLY